MNPENRHKSRGLTRLVQAWGYSCNGLALALRSEAALRQELALTLLLLPLGLWLGHNGAERALLAGSLLLVLVVELLNTAVEYAIDRVSLQPHALSAAAKDVASAAVLLTLLLCGLVWMLILAPRLF